MSWSRNGRKLLTCSTDRLVILWDVEPGQIETKKEFDAAVTFATLPTLATRWHPSPFLSKALPNQEGGTAI